MALEELRLIK